MKDPCIQCDKYDSFLEQNAPQTTTDKNPGDSSLLRRTLQQYQQDHLKYKHLIENAPDAIFVADAETGLIIETNNKAAELLGIPVDQVIGMHQSQLHPSEETQKYTEIFREYIQKGSGYILEDICVCNSDGKKIPVQINASVAQFGNRKVVYGIFRDITERKKLCEQLEISRERFKRLSQATFEGIIFHNNGKFVDSNQQFADMLGYSSDEISRMDGYGLFSPESHKVIREKIAAGDKGPYEAICLRKDGSTVPVEIRARTVQLEGKETRVAAIRDMTELKRNERQLKASEERFKQLAQATFEGIIFHENGIFINSNQQFADMFGYSLDEISGLNGLDLFTPESREIVKEKISSENEGPYEAVCLRKDGSTFPAEIRARTVHLEGRNARVAAIRDLTEQKKLQQQLADSEQLYKDLYRNAKAAIYRTRTSDGKLLACSRVMATLHGYDSIEDCLENHHGAAHYVDKNRRKQLLDKLHEDKQVENFQMQIKRPDGVTVWLELTAELFPEQGWIEGMVTDITASKILTRTEMKILKIILTGKSNKEIAYGLGRSTRTIEDHRAHIMHKLGVDNVVNLTRKALEYGITPNK